VLTMLDAGCGTGGMLARLVLKRFRKDIRKRRGKLAAAGDPRRGGHGIVVD